MNLIKEELPSCNFVVNATLKFETDGSEPLEVYICVDRTAAMKPLGLASFKCGKILYDMILDALETPALTDTMMAEKMKDIIKECDQNNPGGSMYRYFLHYGIRISREIKSERTIQYGKNGKWQWPDFPERIKKIFEEQQ